MKPPTSSKMAYIVIEKAGSRASPIVGPFPSRREADVEAEKQSPRHGGTITVKAVRQTGRDSGVRKTKSRRGKLPVKTP